MELVRATWNHISIVMLLLLETHYGSFEHIFNLFPLQLCNSYYLLALASVFELADRSFSGIFHLVHHTNLLARPLAELLLKYDLKELHVSLTHGLWRYENWGYPVGESLKECGAMWLIIKLNFSGCLTRC